jgi:AraC-like DNA-binding protein
LSVLVSARQGKPGEHLEAWRHHITGVFASATAGSPTAITACSIRISGIGRLLVSEVSADAAVVTPKTVSGAFEGNHYKVALQMQGNFLLEQDGRQTALEPGDFTFFDGRRPFRLAFADPYRTLFFALPPKLLPFDPKRMQQTGPARVSGRQGLGSLVSGFLTQLATEADYLDGQGAERLSGNVADLLTTAFTESLKQDPVAPGDTLRMQVRHYIEQHLDDPGLAPASIAAGCYISTRYLHKIFEHEGTTVTGWIRMRRLEKIRRDLADPLLASRQVGDIGARWGLVNPSQLSRHFRDAYDTSPREYRARATAQQRAARHNGGSERVPDSAPAPARGPQATVRPDQLKPPADGPLRDARS